MQKRKTQKYLILLTLISLFLLLIIQINQLLKTAESEKRHFAQSVKLALNLAVEQISNNQSICKNVRKCIDKHQSDCVKKIKSKYRLQIDSILRYNLEKYKIDIDYNFDIVNSNAGIVTKSDDPDSEKCFTESLDKAFEEAGILLNVSFPDKNKFIVERIGLMFISSVLLIFLVMASFVVSLRLFKKEKKLAEKTKDFIDNMTHEFKTPLANIGFANSRIRTKTELKNSKKLIKYTDIIEYETGKLEGQINEVLKISVLDKEFMTNNSEIINVNLLIEEIISRFDIIISEKNGTIKTNFISKNSFIKGNKIHLVNVFSNILDNSIKYSNGNLKIDVIVTEDINNVSVSFSDNGIGICKKEQNNIFDKYYRVTTGNIHDIKGFGLGLTYVKTVIEQHNGNISLNSKEGKGCKFTVTLPKNHSIKNE